MNWRAPHAWMSNKEGLTLSILYTLYSDLVCALDLGSLELWFCAFDLVRCS